MPPTLTVTHFLPSDMAECYLGETTLSACGSAVFVPVLEPDGAGSTLDTPGGVRSPVPCVLGLNNL